MEELLIDDKKYLSTKRAAKVTGYAKDYVGQLCREGRVPARLVGRSWYVLETAIRAHRFGLTEPSIPSVAVPRDVPESETVIKTSKPEKPVLQATWEPPRYFPASGNDFPPIYPVRTDEQKETAPAQQAGLDKQEVLPSENINQAWREWFADRAQNAELPVGEEATVLRGVNRLLTEPAAPEVIEPVATADDSPGEEVPVVRNEVYTLPAHEEVSRTSPSTFEEVPDVPRRKAVSKKAKRTSRAAVWAVRLIGFLIAATAVTFALFGSGRMDALGLSSGYFGSISGMRVLSK